VACCGGRVIADAHRGLPAKDAVPRVIWLTRQRLCCASGKDGVALGGALGHRGAKASNDNHRRVWWRDASTVAHHHSYFLRSVAPSGVAYVAMNFDRGEQRAGRFYTRHKRAAARGCAQRSDHRELSTCCAPRLPAADTRVIASRLRISRHQQQITCFCCGAASEPVETWWGSIENMAITEGMAYRACGDGERAMSFASVVV